jgi:hypothetical protein
MPFTRTWTEELVAEWLQLNGYVVEVGLPAGVTPMGGRYAADVVCAKVSRNVLEIIHVEVGQLSGGKQSITSLQNKFSRNVCTKIEGYFRQKLGFTTGIVNYQKMYVASFWTKPTLNAVSQLGINVKPLPDFIRQEVFEAIQNWKKHPPHQPKTQGNIITLPESHWLLQLIDYLQSHKLLRWVTNRT